MRRSYANNAMPVQLPCSLRRFHTEIVRRSCGLRTEAARRWCGDCPRPVRSSYDFFLPNDHLKSCDFRNISTRPPRDARTLLPRHVYGLRAYVFFFFYQTCHKSSLSKIVEATAPVNPYGSRVAAACLHTKAAR